ncbi:hypothetical protein BG004_005746 [Podila humilis]|nr:hypothetical protein BG004_005746 [Podila humilis]
MSYSGESWKLPSGTVVDEVIRTLAMNMTKESTLHFFIIDMPKVVMDIFDTVDRAALAQQLKVKGIFEKSETEREMAFLSRYVQTPDATREALSRVWITEQTSLDGDTQYGLHTAVLQLHRVYKQVGFKPPTSKSKSWYTAKLMTFLPDLLCAGDVLSHQPSEVQSKASAQQKNVNRTLSTKRAQGRKIDGPFVRQKTEFEIGALEAARADDGMQGTKTLNDN